MNGENEFFVKIFDHLIDIRQCLDGKDGVIVRLDRLEQLQIQRQKRIDNLSKVAWTAIVSAVLSFVKEFVKL